MGEAARLESAGVTAVEAGPARYRVGVRTLLRLFAGRGSYRLTQLLANALLLSLWGDLRYGGYGAAVAAFGWLIALLQAGPEKTVLKLLPRSPRSGPLITEAVLAGLAGVWLVAVIAFGGCLALGAPGPVVIYAGVATVAVGTGTGLVLAGLHRVGGRPHRDSGASFALTAGQWSLVGVVALGLGPVGYVIGSVALQVLVNAWLLRGLPRPSLRIRERPGFLRRVLLTVVLMGSPEICLFLCSSVRFTVLQSSRWSAQVGPLLVVLLVWSAGITFLLYGLRVYVPQFSLGLAGRAGIAGRARAARLLRWSALAHVVWLATLAGVLAGTPVLAVSRTDTAMLLWAGLAATTAPATIPLIIAGFLVENSDARSTWITGLAALSNLAVESVVGLVLVPRYGGIGVFGTEVIGGLAHVAVMLLLIRRRDRRRDGYRNRLGDRLR
jgi:hypothetical protein